MTDLIFAICVPLLIGAIIVSGRTKEMDERASGLNDLLNKQIAKEQKR